MKKKCYVMLYFLVAISMVQAENYIEAANHIKVKKKIRHKSKAKKSKKRKRNLTSAKPRNAVKVKNKKTPHPKDKKPVRVKSKKTPHSKDKKPVKAKNKKTPHLKDKRPVRVKNKKTVSLKANKETKVKNKKTADIKEKNAVKDKSKKLANLKVKKRVKAKGKKRIKIKTKKRVNVKVKKGVNVKVNKRARLKKQKIKKANKAAANSTGTFNAPDASTYISDFIEEYEQGLISCSDLTERRYGVMVRVFYIAYQDIWKTEVEQSFNKVIPLLWHKETLGNLKIVAGPKNREAENLINKIADILDPEKKYFLIMRFMGLLEVLGANADTEKIQHKKRQLETLKAKPEIVYELSDLLSKHHISSFHTASHFARNTIPPYFKPPLDMFHGAGFENVIQSKFLIDLEKKMGSPLSNLAKKDPNISAFLRFLLIELAWADTLDRLTRLWEHFKIWWAIISNFRASWSHQFKYESADLQGHNPQIHPTPVGRTLLFKALNLINTRLALFIATPLHFLLNPLQEFYPARVLKALDVVYAAIMGVYYNCKRLQIVTNALIELLHAMNNTVTLIEEMKKMLEEEENADIKSAFEAEYKKIKTFVKSKRTQKLRKILATLKKVRKEPVTLRFILNPFHFLPTRLMATYIKLLQEPEIAEEYFKEAHFACLKILYASAKVQAVLLAHGGQTPYPVCITDIPATKGKTAKELTAKKPSMEGNDFYNPLLYGGDKEIVTNNIKIGGKYKHCIFMGPNGSGKSVAEQAVLINAITSQGMGVSFASYFKIDVLPYLIIHDANAADNIIENKSLFQDEVQKYEKLLKLIKKYNLPTLVSFDEKLSSTVPKEATILLTCMLLRLDEELVTMLISSHFREMYKLLKKLKLDQFKFMSTEYKKQTGFTFKIKEGLSQDPAAVYALQDMAFDKATLDNFVKLLSEDPTYEFKHKLPGYKIRAAKKYFFKVLRILFYLILLLILLGLGFLFFRKFKINIKIEKKGKDKDKEKKGIIYMD